MGSVRDSVRSRCRDEQRRDAVPAPSAPPGGAQGARAQNGAEMATAGLTDSAAPRAPPAPGTARAAGLPAPAAAAAQQVDTAVPRDPTDPRRHRLPPPGLAFPPPRPGLLAREASRRTPIPGLNIRALTCAQPVPPGESPKRGVRPSNARLGGRGTDPDSSPQARRKEQRESGLRSTHLSWGPVFRSGSSDVRVAATWSRRRPRPMPPAAARQLLLTAHARAAAGGRRRRPRREPRAPARRGQRPWREGRHRPPRARPSAPGLRGGTSSF